MSNRLAKRRKHLFSKWPWLSLLGLIIVSVTVDLYLGRGWAYWKNVPVEWEKFNWQAAATAFVGIVAIITLYTSRELQERQFTIKARNEEFADVLDRLADNENPLMRAHASNRLADMAIQPFLSKLGLFRRYDFPLFGRAASQLSDLLLMENDPVVRAVAVKALGRMRSFAAGENQPLLYAQIIEIVRVNRHAREILATTLGKYDALIAGGQGLSVEDFQKLVEITALCGLGKEKRNPTLASLCALTCTKEYINARDANWIIRETSTISTANSEAAIYQEIQSHAARLIDIVHALTDCLNALTVFDVPRHAGEEFPNQKTPQLNLENCFLGGANLKGAYLQGSNLQNTFLAGIDFTLAHLQSAMLTDSHLEFAKIGGANLTSATLAGTKLFGIEFRAIDRDKQLEPDFTGSNWWAADFQAPSRCQVRGREALQVWGTVVLGESLEDWLKLKYSR